MYERRGCLPSPPLLPPPFPVVVFLSFSCSFLSFRRLLPILPLISDRAVSPVRALLCFSLVRVCLAVCPAAGLFVLPPPPVPPPLPLFFCLLRYLNLHAQNHPFSHSAFTSSSLLCAVSTFPAVSHPLIQLVTSLCRAMIPFDTILAAFFASQLTLPNCPLGTTVVPVIHPP